MPPMNAPQDNPGEHSGRHNDDRSQQQGNQNKDGSSSTSGRPPREPNRRPDSKASGRQDRSSAPSRSGTSSRGNNEQRASGRSDDRSSGRSENRDRSSYGSGRQSYGSDRPAYGDAKEGRGGSRGSDRTAENRGRDTRPSQPGRTPSSETGRNYRNDRNRQGEANDRQGNRDFESRSNDGERRTRNEDGSSGSRPSYGDRDSRPMSGSRDARSTSGARDSRPAYGERDSRPAYGDRSQKASYGDDRRTSGGGSSRHQRSEAPKRAYGDRPTRPGYQGKPDRDERPRGPRAVDRDVTGPRNGPEIPEEVQFSDLDKEARAPLRTLSKDNAETVGRHLAMVVQLIDQDPELAYQHAQAAVRNAGRVDVVREAAGISAYRTGRYAEALRELRTVRRLNGSSEHLPIMADCERGLRRPERALDLAASPEAQTLDAEGKVELAIVVSGARMDLAEPEAAQATLDALNLDGVDKLQRLRVLQAKAGILEATGRTEEAAALLKGVNKKQLAAAVGGMAPVEDVVVYDLSDSVSDEELEKQETTETNDNEATSREAEPESAPSVDAALNTPAADSHDAASEENPA